MKDPSGRLVVNDSPVDLPNDGMESAVVTGPAGPSNAIVVLDGDGKVRWASKAAVQLIGASMGELIGRPLAEFAGASAGFAREDAGTLTLACRSGHPVRFSRLTPAGRTQDASVGAVWTLEPAAVASPAPWKAAVTSSGLGLLAASGDGAFQLSTDGRYLDASQSFAEICGYGDLRAFLAAAPPLYVDPHRRIELMKRLRQLGSVTHFESAITRRDGTLTWISESIAAVRDPSGRVLHYEGTAHNIGWRKLAEEILNQAEEKWRALVESSGECIVITDRTGLILFSNARARTASIGLPGASIFTEFAAGSQPALEAAIHRALDRMTAVAITLERVGESRAIYEVRVVPIGGAESAPRVILIASDLTERMRAEQAVREGQRLIGRVADASPAILYVFDFGSERYAYVNHQVEKILGYTSEALLAGGKVLANQLLHPEDAQLLAERRRLLVQAKDDNVVFEYTFRMRHAQGHWLWMRARDVVFTRTPDGTPAQIIGMAEDVTERRRAGEERERSREQLRALSARLQEAREEESAAISRRVHDELGQALTALSWELTKLNDRLTPTTRAMPEVAQRISSMGGMIDATLQIVRKIAAELRPPILDHFGLLAALEWQAKEFQERYRIACEVAIRGQPSIADRDISTAVFRIFQEVLTNVARHAGATKVRVQFGENSEGYALIVHDNGRGITEGEKTQSLGILGMKERAHIFGGSIEITGAAGKGTTVTVRIPHPEGAAPSVPRKETLRRRK